MHLGIRAGLANIFHTHRHKKHKDGANVYHIGENNPIYPVVLQGSSVVTSCRICTVALTMLTAITVKFLPLLRPAIRDYKLGKDLGAFDFGRVCIQRSHYDEKFQFCPVPSFDYPLNERAWRTTDEEYDEEIAKIKEDADNLIKEMQKNQEESDAKYIREREESDTKYRKEKEEMRTKDAEVDKELEGYRTWWKEQDLVREQLEEIEKQEYNEKEEQRKKDFHERFWGNFFKFIHGDQEPFPQPPQNCTSLGLDTYKDLSDMERPLHPDLNPECVPDAKIILLAPEDADCTRVKKIQKKMLELIHPDKNPNDQERANKATAKVNRAAEVLCKI